MFHWLVSIFRMFKQISVCSCLISVVCIVPACAHILSFCVPINFLEKLELGYVFVWRGSEQNRIFLWGEVRCPCLQLKYAGTSACLSRTMISVFKEIFHLVFFFSFFALLYLSSFVLQNGYCSKVLLSAAWKSKQLITFPG